MGRKSGSVGNAYKNPVDHYRKQLGRNEERPVVYKPRTRLSKPKHLSPRELARSKLIPRSWKTMTVYLVLFVGFMAAVYVFMALEAGNYLYGLLIEEDISVNDHIRVHRDM